MKQETLTKEQMIVSNNNGEYCDIEFLNGSIKKVGIEFEFEGMLSFRLESGKGSRIIARFVKDDMYKVVSGLSYLDLYRTSKKKKS